MITNNTKKEKIDLYIALVVLALFCLLGLYIIDYNPFKSNAPVWLEKPSSPASFVGHPQPHNDESYAGFEKKSKLPPHDYSVKDNAAVATDSTNWATKSYANATDTSFAMDTDSLAAQKQADLAYNQYLKDSLAEIAANTPDVINNQTDEFYDEIDDLQVDLDDVEDENYKDDLEDAVVEEEPTVEKVIATPTPTPKPKKTIVPKKSQMNYITNDLPCVWVVGVFRNPGNVNRVVARLRLNKFDVATGAHEKGSYVGVPCDCDKEDPKGDQLREIFAAQPWMLKK